MNTKKDNRSSSWKAEDDIWDYWQEVDLFDLYEKLFLIEQELVNLSRHIIAIHDYLKTEPVEKKGLIKVNKIKKHAKRKSRV